MCYLILALLISGAAKAETYNECILESMKGVGGDMAARLVHKACRDKVLPHVPAKCKVESDIAARDPFASINPYARFAPADQIEKTCIESCLNASYWSKHFGECAP